MGRFSLHSPFEKRTDFLCKRRNKNGNINLGMENITLERVGRGCVLHIYRFDTLLDGTLRISIFPKWIAEGRQPSWMPGIERLHNLSF